MRKSDLFKVKLMSLWEMTDYTICIVQPSL